MVKKLDVTDKDKELVEKDGELMFRRLLRRHRRIVE